MILYMTEDPVADTTARCEWERNGLRHSLDVDLRKMDWNRWYLRLDWDVRDSERATWVYACSFKGREEAAREAADLWLTCLPLAMRYEAGEKVEAPGERQLRAFYASAEYQTAHDEFVGALNTSHRFAAQDALGDVKVRWMAAHPWREFVGGGR